MRQILITLVAFFACAASSPPWQVYFSPHGGLRFAYVTTGALRVLNRNEEAGEWMETTVGRAKDLRALAERAARDSSQMTKLWRERRAR